MKHKNTFLFSFILFLVLSSVIYLSISAFYLDKETKNVNIEQQPKFSKVKIYATKESDFERIQNTGLFLTEGIHKQGQYYETILPDYQIKLLNNSGVPYEILIDDVDTYQKNLPKMSDAEIQKEQHHLKETFNISHSIYGTMRGLGYLKYSEVVAKLDSMRLQYPSLISVKWSLGTTIESRSIWCVRITKNPDAVTGKPQVMLHATIHAREPEGMEAQCFFVYWLLENYGIDPMATFILNNREIYWVPILNPDGYVYNETYSGGQWRCNKHVTTPNCGYVDLNRNYGIYSFWNSSNGGSSTDPCSGGAGTYRGTLPFSENETQAIMNLVNTHNFNTGLGAHTSGNDFIKPWAWCDPTPTPDDNKFNVFLADMTIFNQYRTGTAHGLLNYYVRGGSDDWYYQDSINPTHHIFVMTPETGNDFWEAQILIVPDAQIMLWAYQYITLVAGSYCQVTSTPFNQPYYTAGQSGTFKVKFTSKGLTTAANVHVIWNPVNSYVTIPTQQYNYTSEPWNTNDSTTFSFTLANNAPSCGIPTVLTIKIDTATEYVQNVYINVGAGTITLADSAENGIGHWTVQGGWALNTSSYHSPTHSFAYTPYPNNANYSLTLSSPINMASYPVCYLTYWNRYDLESSFDYGYVEYSTDNGNNWDRISSYTGTNLTWTQQSFNITSIVRATSQFLIRFRLFSDQGTVNTGWWIDDIKITNYCIGAVGISGNNSILTKRFALEQNYPNPFNPRTNIKYQLPVQSNVTIKIFDLLGKEVATLVNNELKDAGYYNVNFDASNLASGMYFYKIDAGTFTDTKKMVLVK